MNPDIKKELFSAKQLMGRGEYKKAHEIIKGILTHKRLSKADYLASLLLDVQLTVKTGDYEKANEQIEKILIKSRESGYTLLLVDVLLNKIEICWRIGNLDKGLQVGREIEDLLKKIDSNSSKKPEIDKRKGKLFRSRGIIEWYKGNLDQALDHLQKSLNTLKEHNDWQGVASVLNNMSLVHRSKGTLDKAIECLQQSLESIEEPGDDQILASIFNNFGIVYQMKGDHKKALDYYQRSLVLKEKIGNEPEIALSLINLGVNSRMQGRLNQALEYYQQAQIIFEKSGDKKNIALVLNNLGDVYELKGDLNLALEYFQESLSLYEELGFKEDIAMSLGNIGEIYQKKKNSKWAKKFFLRSLKISRETNNDLSTSIIFYQLILLGLDINDPLLTQEYLQELKDVNERTKNRVVDHRYRVAKALYLKQNPRARIKMKATDLLEEVIEEETSDYNLTVTAMINLCDLLLYELKMTGEETILDEVKQLTNRLLEIAEKQSSHSLFAETYVLQSKLALLEFNIRSAQKLLDKALSIAEEKGLRNLAIKIYNDRTSLEAQVEEWEFLTKQKAPLAERLELTRLEEMLSRIEGNPFEITEEEVKTYAKRAKQVMLRWEEVPKRKYNLVHLDLLKDSLKTERTNFRVAVAQLGVSKEDNLVNEFYQENSDGLFCLRDNKVETIKLKVKELVENAHFNDVKILLFPELSIDFNYEELLDIVTNLAKKYKIYIIPGSYHDQHTKRNVCMVIGPDGVLWQQEKHIPAIIHYQGRRIKEGIETDIFPRNTFICRTEFGNIAITICRDFLDMDLRVELKNSDPPVDLIFNPAFTPVTVDFQAAHFDARRSIYAYCFFANIAEIGESFIFTPEREQVERKIPAKEEKLIYKDVDLFRLRSERKKWEFEQAKNRGFIQSTRS